MSLPYDTFHDNDDPCLPTDPTWEELRQQLGEAGLDWSDLTSWTLGPCPEDLDLLPGELAVYRAEGGGC